MIVWAGVDYQAIVDSDFATALFMFSRGCPHPCEYCAVQTYYQRSYRTRPVDDVMEDLRRIKALGGNRVLFLDDNPIAHPNDRSPGPHDRELALEGPSAPRRFPE